MKKIIYTIILLIVIFLVNLLLFFFNDSYKEIIYEMKHKDSNDFLVTDEYKIKKLEEIKKKEEIKKIEKKEEIKNNFIKNKKQNEIRQKILERKEKKEGLDKIEKLEKEFGSIASKNNINNTTWKKIEKSIGISREEKKNIDFIRFNFKGYNLKLQQDKNIIFNLTTEFPPERYLEYNSSNLYLYFFVNTSYEKVLEIFDVLSYEASFKINKTNTFGDKSFYLNGYKDDGFIKIIIEYKKNTFGIQVKKKYYENVKSILSNKLI